jgi:hypothetical protein
MDTKVTNAKKEQNIDSLIKEVLSHKLKSSQSPESQIVIVDKDSGNIIHELPVLRFLSASRYRYFEVNLAQKIFNVVGPNIKISHPDLEKQVEIEIVFDINLKKDGLYELVKSVKNATTPITALTNKLKQEAENFISGKNDFIRIYKDVEDDFKKRLISAASEFGVEIAPTIKHPWLDGITFPDRIQCSGKMNIKTSDGEDIELYYETTGLLTDIIKYKLSRITEINDWVCKKIEKYITNLIEHTKYEDVVINFDIEKIKEPFQKDLEVIGISLKTFETSININAELFSIILDNSETGGPMLYTTTDPRVKISLITTLNGKFDFQPLKMRKWIKPNTEILPDFRKSTLEIISDFLSKITPDESLANLHSIEKRLFQFLKNRLEDEFSFIKINLSITRFESTLLNRLYLLQESSYKVDIHSHWEMRNFALWFKVLDISENDWKRFWTNNYPNLDNEINDISRMVRNAIESQLIRTKQEQAEDLIKKAFADTQKLVKREFGLNIHLHDLIEGMSDEEKSYIRRLKEDIAEEYKRQRIINNSSTQELEYLVSQKEELLKQGKYMDEEKLQEINLKIISFKKDSEQLISKFLREKTLPTSLLVELSDL